MSSHSRWGALMFLRARAVTTVPTSQRNSNATWHATCGAMPAAATTHQAGVKRSARRTSFCRTPTFRAAGLRYRTVSIQPQWFSIKCAGPDCWKVCRTVLTSLLFGNCSPSVTGTRRSSSKRSGGWLSRQNFGTSRTALPGSSRRLDTAICYAHWTPVTSGRYVCPTSWERRIILQYSGLCPKRPFDVDRGDQIVCKQRNADLSRGGGRCQRTGAHRGRARKSWPARASRTGPRAEGNSDFEQRSLDTDCV